MSADLTGIMINTVDGPLQANENDLRAAGWVPAGEVHDTRMEWAREVGQYSDALRPFARMLAQDWDNDDDATVIVKVSDIKRACEVMGLPAFPPESLSDTEAKQ